MDANSHAMAHAQLMTSPFYGAASFQGKQTWVSKMFNSEDLVS